EARELLRITSGEQGVAEQVHRRPPEHPACSDHLEHGPICKSRLFRKPVPEVEQSFEAWGPGKFIDQCPANPVDRRDLRGIAKDDLRRDLLSEVSAQKVWLHRGSSY